MLVIVLVLSAALAAVADKLVLKDGRKYEGTVLEETDLVIKFRTAKAVLTFKKEEIESLERGKTIVAEREERLTALKPENPAGYIEMAEWLQGPGKELFDEAMFSRLCNIAAFLDKGLACKAQLMLGRYSLSKGRKEAAAVCYFRALTADPANEEAIAKARDLKAGLDAAAKKEMTDISRALNTFLDGKTKEAIPLLRDAAKRSFSERAKEFMGMTIDELADELQSRAPCDTCKGKGKANCTPCKGTGLIPCEACDGTGIKKGAPAKPTFKQEVCRDCYHGKALLCQSCLAERTAKIHFTDSEVVAVPLQAGVEHAACLARVLFDRPPPVAFDVESAAPPRFLGNPGVLAPCS